MPENSQDLLYVSVSETGLAHLRRLAIGTRWTFVLGIVLNAVLLINAFLQWSLINGRGAGDNPRLLLYITAYVWVMIISEGFNASLNLLNRFNRLALINISLNLAYGLFQMWVQLNALAISRIRHLLK